MLEIDRLKNLKARTDELHELLIKYDSEEKSMQLYEKNEFLQEISIKIQLVISYILKAVYNLTCMAEQGAFISRAEVRNTLTDLREQLKVYSSMAWSFSEVLRSSRIKLEYNLDLDKQERGILK